MSPRERVAPILSLLLPLVASAAFTSHPLDTFVHLPSLVGIICAAYIISAVHALPNIVPRALVATDHPHGDLIYFRNKSFALQLAPVLPVALFLFTTLLYIQEPERIGRGVAYAVFGMIAAQAILAYYFSREIAAVNDAAAARIFRTGLLARFVAVNAIAIVATVIFFYTVFFALSDDKSVAFLDPFVVFGGDVRFDFHAGYLLPPLMLAAGLYLVNLPRLRRRKAFLRRGDHLLVLLCALAWGSAVAAGLAFVQAMSSLAGPQVADRYIDLVGIYVMLFGVVLAGAAWFAWPGRTATVRDLKQPVWSCRRGLVPAFALLFGAGFMGSLLVVEASRYSVAASVALFAAIAFNFSSRRRLEEIISDRTHDLNVEKSRVESLLSNILPSYVIEDLKRRGVSEPRSFENVAVLFTDFVGFTKISSEMEPSSLIAELNEMFTAFDEIVMARGAERIKTIGDAYMAVCGLAAGGDEPSAVMIECAKSIIAYLERRNAAGKIQWRIRIGIAGGASVGGVVGRTKYLFDLFGDTINTASRMETHSEPMRINVSDYVRDRLKDRYAFIEREPIEVKGKGLMRMYFLA